MKGRITKTGYRRNSPDVNNDFNIIPSNRISMKGVDFPVFGVDNMGNSQIMYPGGEYEYQGDYVTELPAYGSGGLTQWFAEKWVDIKTGKKCGRSGKDKNGRPYPACRPSKRVNSTTPKTKSEMSAAEKAKFKKSKTSGKRIDYNHKRAQQGIEVPRTIRYENSKMVLQDKPIYDGMLDEVTVTPYTASQYAWQENRANQATGGLEPVYPIFDALTLGLGAPSAIRKAPSVLNPKYFKPNSNMYYRGIGKEGMKDALESGLFRAKPADKIPPRMIDLGNIGQVDMAKRFKKTYYSPFFNVADNYGGGYIAEVPKNAANFAKRYKNADWSIVTKDQIPVNAGRILEKNWWSGYKPIKAFGGSLPKAQEGIEVIGRNGVRPNPDGKQSTHIMAREYVDGRGWVAFPTLFQNPDSSWVDMSLDSAWEPAYEEALRRGEVYDFGEDVEAAIKFADDGSWKKQQGGQQGPPYLTPGPIQDKVYPTSMGPVEDSLENRIINSTISEPKNLNRRDALLNASKRVSQGQGGRSLEVLLNLTAAMENSLGEDSNAYGRDYTRGPMSIDDNAFADIYNKRGTYDYTSSQKKGFDWLKTLGLEPTKMDSLLRADDPLASMATARLVYGRAPEALPSPEDPKALYDYYMNNYNKSGALKYGDKDSHYKRFLGFYNDLYGQKKDGGETLPDYSKYDTQERAWFAARKELGKGKAFMYGGQKHFTYTPKGL
jgi:hypothetical protein